MRMQPSLARAALVLIATSALSLSLANAVDVNDLQDAIKAWWTEKGAESKFMEECTESFNTLCGTTNCKWRGKSTQKNAEEMAAWLHRHMHETITKLMKPLCKPWSSEAIREEGKDCSPKVADYSYANARAAWTKALSNEDAFKDHAAEFAHLLPVIMKTWQCDWYKEDWRKRWTNTQILNPTVGLFEMPKVLHRYNTGHDVSNQIAMEMSWFYIQNQTGYPLHGHAALEAYYVMGETEFGFNVDGKFPPMKHTAQAGKWMCIPPNVLHFINPQGHDHVSISMVEAFAGSNQLNSMPADVMENMVGDDFEFAVGSMAESMAPATGIMIPTRSHKTINYEEYDDGWLGVGQNGVVPVEFWPKYGPNGGKPEGAWHPMPGWTDFDFDNWREIGNEFDEACVLRSDGPGMSALKGDPHVDDVHISCGDLKNLYKTHQCCGSPQRRLEAFPFTEPTNGNGVVSLKAENLILKQTVKQLTRKLAQTSELQIRP